MRVADYVVNKIYEEGTDHIFMISGRGSLFLNDANFQQECKGNFFTP